MEWGNLSKGKRGNGVKSFGQYVTPKFVAEFMASLISKTKSARVLEPGAGEGVFLKVLRDRGYNDITAYEIDERLGRESPLKITYRDFFQIPPEPNFDVIIGNPPYVRWKNIPREWRMMFKKSEYWKIINGLCDLTYAFIYHGVNFLKKNGELIFICPLFWTETVHGKHLRAHLSKNGSVELLINLNEARVFNEVSSTIIIFKYVKNVKLPCIKIVEYRSKEPVTLGILDKISSLIKKVELQAMNPALYIEEGVYRAYLNEPFLGSEPWHPIPPTEKIVKKIDIIEEVARIGNIADIGNGMVSGLDKAFKLEEEELKLLNEHERRSVIHVFKAKTLERFSPRSEPIPYIFTNNISSEEKLKQEYPYFHLKLLPYKEKLKRRYDYAKDIPWWHWVFLRNKGLFERYDVKIFVPSKERYDTRGYFRFALIHNKNGKTSYATQDVTAICVRKGTQESNKYVLGLLNSEPIQEWIIVKGFTRGGVYDFSVEPLKIIPLPKVNWSNKKEVELHRLIVETVEEIIHQKQINKLPEMNNYVAKMIKTKEKLKTPPSTAFM